MCGGGGGGTRVEYVYKEPEKQPDPTPTPVSVSDVTKSASAERAAVDKQRRMRGQSANAVATDRQQGTILGSVSNALSNFRQTLG